MSPYEPRHEKTYNVVSEQVQHKLSSTMTENGYMLEILDLESREIVKTKALISFAVSAQLILRLCFCIMQNVDFLMTRPISWK